MIKLTPNEIVLRIMNETGLTQEQFNVFSVGFMELMYDFHVDTVDELIDLDLDDVQSIFRYLTIQHTLAASGSEMRTIFSELMTMGLVDEITHEGYAPTVYGYEVGKTIFNILDNQKEI